MRRSDGIFRKHQYEDFGIVDGRHDLISVLRSGRYIARRNPAFDPVLLEILDDRIGNCRILRCIANEYVAVDHRLLSGILIHSRVAVSAVFVNTRRVISRWARKVMGRASLRQPSLTTRRPDAFDPWTVYAGPQHDFS